MAERPAHNYFLTEDARQRINRFVGPVAFSLAAAMNPIAAVAAAVGLVGYEWWRVGRLEDEQAKRLLNASEAELCQITSAPLGKLKLSDFDRFAQAQPGSAEAVTAFRLFRENGAKGRKFSVLSTALAVGATALFAASGGLAAVVGLMAEAGIISSFFTSGIVASSVVGGFYLASKSLVDSQLNPRFLDSVQPNITSSYMMLAQQIQEKSLGPLQVFGLFVQARPSLDAAIRQAHGRSFFSLPVEQKHRVIVEFEPSIKAIALTEAVNKGYISKGMLLLIPFEDGKQLPGYAAYRALSSKPMMPATSHAAGEQVAQESHRQTTHVAELEKSREQQAQMAREASVTLH
jgi:hypothetical protein